MKLALDPALLNDRPVSSALPIAAACDYTAVELSSRDDFIPAFAPVAATEEQLAEVGKISRSADVAIASVAIIQAWSSADEERRIEAVEWWIDGIHAAIDLGCRRINSELSGDPNSPETCRSAFLRSMEALLPVLEREGAVLSIEPHPWDFLETTAATLDLMQEVDSPRVKYLHCIPHTYYLGGTVTNQISLSKDKVDHIHIADTFRPERIIVNPPGLDHRVHQHFDIGTAEIDWIEVVDALTDIGFNGLMTVQVFGWPEVALDSFRSNRRRVEMMFDSIA